MKDCFHEILNENSLMGSYGKFNNNYKTDHYYENFITKVGDTHIIEKPLIAISSNIKI